MYDGTVTISDPSLVETWTDEIEGHTIYLRYDDNPENPRRWYDHATALVGTDSSYIEPDGEGDWRHDAVRSALAQWWGNGWYSPHRDRERLTERYLRIFHDAAAVVIEDCGADRDYHPVVGWITREAAEREGFANPEAVVKADLAEYAQWASGQVYGVTVVRNEDGAEASLWGVYDDSHDFRYVLEVARDLAEEVE